MKQMSTTIAISAPPAEVWKILTDFPALPEWNPFMRSGEGEIVVGERLKIYLKPPKGMGMTIRPIVLKADEDSEFRWLGHLGVSGLFDGEHYFTIEALGGEKVRFTQGEVFTGVLVPLMSVWGLFKNTMAGFEGMNSALKERAENSS